MANISMKSHYLYILCIAITFFGRYLGIISADTTDFVFIAIIVHWVLDEKFKDMVTIGKYEKNDNNLYFQQLVSLIIMMAALSIYDFFLNDKYDHVIITLVLMCVILIIFTKESSQN